MRVSVFAISLGLTLLLEVTFAWLWGLRDRHNLTAAVLVNVLTNPAVVLLKALGVPILLLEAAAIIAEGWCYQVCGESVRRPWLLALLANVFSYGTGLVLSAIL